jgi:hypothetical protein
VTGRSFDSWIPVFQEHQTGKGRNGTNQRLQCQGDDWDASVEAFLKSREQVPKKPSLRTAAEQQQTAAEQQQLQTEARTLERKLHIALNCAKSLVSSTNMGVHNSNVLKSEPGCETCSAELNMKNTSLLLSTLGQLPQCPGATDRSRRFEYPHKAPIGSAPVAGAAAGPAGDAAARAAGETAATADKDRAPGPVLRRSRRAKNSQPAGPADRKVCGQVTHPLSLRGSWLIYTCAGCPGPDPAS